LNGISHIGGIFFRNGVGYISGFCWKVDIFFTPNIWLKALIPLSEV